MLFRYAFPVPRHGEMISVTRYVESDKNPTKAELLHLFEDERSQAQKRAEASPETEILWREVKNWEGCIYALRNIKAPELPNLPANGLSDISIFCQTELEQSAIRITLIKPLSLKEPRLRLAVGS